MKKNNLNIKGVTLITLVVTIIVMIILISVATYSGINVIQSTKFTAFTTQLKIMQTHVNQLYDEAKENPEVLNSGEVLTDTTKLGTILNKLSEENIRFGGQLEDYRYFSEKTIKDLGIEGVDSDYFVNIKVRAVISCDGIQFDEKTYYVLDQIPDSLYNVEYENKNAEIPTFDVNIVKVAEGKWRMTIYNISYSGYIDKWEIKYQKEGQGYWNTTEDMTFYVNEEGEYNIKIANGDVESREGKYEIIHQIELWSEPYEKTAPYTADNRAIIPEGFKVSLKDEENKVDNGLVVQAPDGSEFVWIPVAKNTFSTKFKRAVGYRNGTEQSYWAFYNEANSNGTNSRVTESATTQQEAKEMYTSVKENGGFYIARYEAGQEDGKVVSKKAAAVYSNIKWGNTMTDDTGGAVQVAREMDSKKGEEYKGVTSTLCYGVQWDAALNFIDPNYITNEVSGKPNCDGNSYVKDSGGKGWYKDLPEDPEYQNPEHNTGIDVDEDASNKQKNIYDMAGNVWEWTMESYQTSIRVCRGGSFDSIALSDPASSRNNYNPSNSAMGYGFRPALFIKAN